MSDANAPTAPAPRDIATVAERELLGGVRALVTAACTETCSAMLSMVAQQARMILGQMLRAAAVTTSGLTEAQAAAVGERIDLALSSRESLQMPVPVFSVARAEDGRLRVDGSIDLSALRLAYVGEIGASAKAKTSNLHEFTALVDFPALELVLPAPQIVVSHHNHERGATRQVVTHDDDGNIVGIVTRPLEG